MKESGYSGLVLTRVRLTRNLKGMPFSWKAAPAQKRLVSAAIGPMLSRITKGKAVLLGGSERSAFMRRHFPSTKAGRLSGVEVWLLDGRETSAVVNYVDHLCIQSCRPGLLTGRILRELESLGERIDPLMRPARNREWGFLTASPADAGRGIGVSYLADFSALSRTGTLAFALDRLRRSGFACRPRAGGKRRGFWHLSSAKPYGFQSRSSLFQAERTLAQMMTMERAAADIAPAKGAV